MDFNRILYSEISFKPAVIATSSLSSNDSSGCINNYNNHNHNNNSNNNISINNNNINNNHNPINGNNNCIKTSYNSNSNHFSNAQRKSLINGTAGDSLDEFQLPRHQLCDPNIIQLDWVQSEKVGGGLINVGNTCFLNSVLQCLTYCPPLYNFLVKFNGGHSNTCKINQFCMLCEMEKHVKRIKNSNGGSIKPISIVQRLKYINKSFQFGRQEDAHEFLRYIIDHMWKACLLNHDVSSKISNGTTKHDPKIKETTIINHIFGGYHRSQVLCLTCNSRSNTFDFFMDFILDIRNAKSLEEALKKFTQPETLQNENAYKCGKCRKKVTARKKFTVFKAPNVATFQLKRFDSDRIFGGKVTKFISYPEELDLGPYMSDPTKAPIKYQLSAVLVHVGHSSNSGHYFCFIKNSNKFWYRMDDSNVSLVTPNTVLQQQAYVLFYNRKSNDSKNSVFSLLAHDSNKHLQPARIQHQHHSHQHQQIQKHHKNHSQTFSRKFGFQRHPSNNGLIRGTHASSAGSSSSISSTPTGGFFTTWFGSNSNLDGEDSCKRKLNEMTERDKYNEEIDQGKTKKIKSRLREDRFVHLAKTNPFQRFSSNGYQQYNNKKQ